VHYVYWPVMEERKGQSIQSSEFQMLVTELSLSSRERMTLVVEVIFWFISHTLPQWHASKALEIHTYRLLASQEYARC
jgi:hypothetical protein